MEMEIQLLKFSFQIYEGKNLLLDYSVKRTVVFSPTLIQGTNNVNKLTKLEDFVLAA